MTKTGRLNPMRTGYSMPGDAPLYPRPPVYYREATYLTVAFETEEAAVLDVLPEGLAVTSPAVAAVTVASYPFSTLGAYDEAILTVNCLWQGQPHRYIAHIVLTSDSPLAAGREIWGFPKKLAHVELRGESDVFIGTVERPRGNRLCTAIIRPEQPVPTDRPIGDTPFLSLRVIPSPEESRAPALAELVSTSMPMSPLHLWRGTASLSFDARSELDPWYRFAPKRIVAAYYGKFDVVLPYGKVVHRYS